MAIQTPFLNAMATIAGALFPASAAIQTPNTDALPTASGIRGVSRYSPTGGLQLVGVYLVELEDAANDFELIGDVTAAGALPLPATNAPAFIGSYQVLVLPTGTSFPSASGGVKDSSFFRVVTSTVQGALADSTFTAKFFHYPQQD